DRAGGAVRRVAAVRGDGRRLRHRGRSDPDHRRVRPGEPAGRLAGRRLDRRSGRRSRRRSRRRARRRSRRRPGRGLAAGRRGLAAAGVAVPLGQRVLRHNGVYVHPATALTELRVVAGTAALLAVAAVLAFAIAAAVRRGAAAVAAVIVVIVLPYLLAVTALPV